MVEFESYRGLLFSIAYRMLGTVHDAEDVVQEGYVRYREADVEHIGSLRHYLTTIVTRLCINRLNSARYQRETYPGPWLPEPILGDPNLTGPDPADEVALYDSISYAFLTVLERLTAPERASLLLREVFDYDYAEIANILEKEESACRQLVSRARKHITEDKPRFQTTPEEHRGLLESFIQAAQVGEMDALLDLLSQDVKLIPDGGGVRGAALRVLEGAKVVAEFVIGSQKFSPEGTTFAIEQVNGREAIVLRAVDNTPFLVIVIETNNGLIQQIYVVGGEKVRRT